MALTIEVFKTNLKHLYPVRRPLVTVAFLYIGSLFFLSRTEFWSKPGLNDPSQWNGSRVRLTGVVQSAPDLTPKGLVLLVETETIFVGTTAVSTPGLVRTQISQGENLNVQPGDRIQIWGRLSASSPSRIPGTFDFSEYLKKRGIHSVVYAGASSVRNLGPSHKKRWTRWGWKMNQALITRFNQALPPHESIILSGLVAGQRPRLDPEVQRAFVESGTMHILVASGTNIAFVLGAWYLFMRILFRLPKRLSLLTALMPIWIYAACVGGDAPILRAALMISFGVVGYALSREAEPLQLWSLSAFILLLITPAWISDLGFQMSFLTVAGLLLTPFPVFPQPSRFGRWFRWPLQLAWASLVAQLWLFPLSAGVFKKIYPISLAANLVIVPFSAGGLVAGMGVFASPLIFKTIFMGPWISKIITTAAAYYLHLLYATAQFFSTHPGWTIWTSTPDWIWTIGFYLLCLSIPRLLHSKWTQGLTILGCALLLFGHGPFRTETRINQPRFTWIDAGRGLGTLVESPQGIRILILDNSKVSLDVWERILMPYFSESGISRLSLLITPRGLDSSLQQKIKSWIRTDQLLTMMPGVWSQKDCRVKIFDPLDGFTHSPPIFVTCADTTILISKGLGLKMQEAILQEKWGAVDGIQGSFSIRSKWDENFVSHLNPKVIIETGFNSERRPSIPPWKKALLIVPQKVGIFIWEKTLRTRSTTGQIPPEKIDQNKTG